MACVAPQVQPFSAGHRVDRGFGQFLTTSYGPLTCSSLWEWFCAIAPCARTDAGLWTRKITAYSKQHRDVMTMFARFTIPHPPETRKLHSDRAISRPYCPIQIATASPSE